MMMVGNSVISFFIAVIMLFSAIPADAQVEFLLDPMYNYTEDCTVKMTFNSSKDFVSLLKELEMTEEFEAFADVEKLLETLLSAEGKLFMQADISADMKKVQFALTSDDFNTVDFNRNLQLSVKTKAGIWMMYDFTDAENPAYEVVASLPFMEKYVYIDVLKILPEEQKQKLVSSITDSAQKEKADEINKFFVSQMKEYADISVSLTKATIKLDNDGLIAIIKNMIPYTLNLLELHIPRADGEEIAEIADIVSLDGLQFLGEKGIVFTYNFKNGKISSASSDIDISIDISKIYTKVTGEKWEYISSGKLDFTVETDVTLSKIGSTVVKMPELNENNSISLSDMIESGMAVDPYEEYELNYPYWWVHGDAEKLPVINGEIYVPLEVTLKSAYEESVTVITENGVITASSENFPGFKTMVLTVGSDKISFDGTEKVLNTVISDNDTVYVSSKLFEDIFGWVLTDADYYMLDNRYRFEFETEVIDESETVCPNYYAGGDTEKLPVINGEIYVPLRQTLESGYGEYVQITYENGKITASSEYFPGFKTMILTNGSNKILFDGTEKEAAGVVIEDGVTYVSSKLFTESFGWEFSEAAYYMVEDSYYYDFYTMPDYE